MAYIDFKALKTRVSLLSVLAQYDLDDLEADQTDDDGNVVSYKGACPFCDSRSLKVNASKNTWFCFGGCKTDPAEGEKNGGNLLDFVMRMEGCDIKRAAFLVNSWFPDSTARKPNTKQKPRKKQAAKHATPRTGAKAKEDKPAIQATTTPAPTPSPEDATDEQSTQPEAPAAQQGTGAATPARRDDSGEHLLGRLNPPLDFALKSLDPEHEVLGTLGIAPETLRTFDVGYFTGKGMMQGKVVIPFHNELGLLVAYVGYTPKTGTFTYPDRKHLDPRLELFNFVRAENAGLYMDNVVLVSDLLNVLRLHDLGIDRVVALPTEEISAPQLALLTRLLSDGGRLHYVPWTKEYSRNLDILAEHFHVRLHRYYEGSEDEFLAQVASHFTDW
jgi:hypothetical protein